MFRGGADWSDADSEAGLACLVRRGLIAACGRGRAGMPTRLLIKGIASIVSDHCSWAWRGAFVAVSWEGRTLDRGRYGI